jgi:hypothetical protein
MKALTKTEREALLAEIDAFNTRLVAKQREIDGMTAQKTEISRDVAVGKAGAKALHLELNDAIRESEAEIEALHVAIRQSQQVWDEDAPARDAEAAAERKAGAAEIAVKVIEASERADKALRDFVAAIADRAGAANAFNPFIDLTDQRSVQQVSAILDHALAGAGIRQFDTRYQLQPNGPNSFAEDDARALAAILPPDLPAVTTNRLRQEAINAEHRRQAAPPRLEGEIISRRG